MADPPARVVAELYAVPLGQFTRERDAKAAALAKAGRADEARSIKQLRRPTAALWAVNQLARLDANRLAAFLETVDRIRANQLRDPSAAVEAVKLQRAHLVALLRRAGEALRGEGHRVSAALERRISDTLLGAAVDRRQAEDLRHGRLAAELPPPGFEALTGAPAGGRLRLVPGGKKFQPAEPRRDAEPSRRAEAAAAKMEERRRQAEALAREAAAREAAANELAREATAAAKALAEKRRGLRVAQREARRAAAAARKARGPAAT
jgi:hypothetical protein